MCALHNKKAYPSNKAAIGAALRYSRKRGTALRVYRDPSCGCIHLTSKRKAGWSEVAA